MKTYKPVLGKDGYLCLYACHNDKLVQVDAMEAEEVIRSMKRYVDDYYKGYASRMPYNYYETYEMLEFIAGEYALIFDEENENLLELFNTLDIQLSRQQFLIKQAFGNIAEYLIDFNNVHKMNQHIKKTSKVKRKWSKVGKIAAVSVIVGGVIIGCVCMTNGNSHKESVTTTDSYATYQPAYVNPVIPDNSRPEEVETELDPYVDTQISEDITQETINNESPSFEYYAENDYYSTKMSYTLNKCANIVNQVAPEYGLDPNLILAMICQESGGRHEETLNARGGGVGAMQIQKSVWSNPNDKVKAYERRVRQVVDDNGISHDEYYFVYNPVSVDINRLSDLEYNIRVGCMIFQECLGYTNGNIPLAIQFYNFGCGSGWKMMDKTLEANTSGYTSRSEMYDDQACNEWLNYTEGFAGDPQYINHVMRYLPSDDYIIKCIYPQTNQEISVEVQSAQNIRSR